MNKKYKQVDKKSKMSTAEILIRFFFGFLFPFVFINGLILFLYIQSPKINVIDNDSKDFEDSKIKFTIDCILPITSITTNFQENDIPYTKNNEYYIIDAKENGTYAIHTKALNGAIAHSYVDIETIDTEPPVINSSDAIITASTLTFTVSDNQSGINFDKIYAKTEDGKEIKPSYIDKSSGTVEIPIDKTNKLVVHIEDMNGNIAETTFNISN